MSEVINPLPIPKPKRFAPKEKPPFLPLEITPTSSSLSKVTWSHYTAYLIGHWVTVFHKGDISKLVGSNFGKGALSKFNLTFEDRDWKPVNVEAEKNVPEETENESGPQLSLLQAFEPEQQKPEFRLQMSNRRYQKHCEWSSHTGLREETEPQMKRPRLDEWAASEMVLPLVSDKLNILEDTDSEQEDDLPLVHLPGQPTMNSVPSVAPRRNVVAEANEDPFALKECLLLTHEETFFLSFGLGCLTVTTCSDNPQPLTLVSLWRTFKQMDAKFPARYVAYHYYRAKGWVPRPGLKYGADLLLYPVGPAHYHATFSVIVKETDDQLQELSPDLISFGSGLLRVNEAVGKDLLFCYVVRPEGFTEIEVDSPNCVRRFKVKEVLKKRWTVDKERDQTKAIVAV